jgi:hypothetical protein
MKALKNVKTQHQLIAGLALFLSFAFNNCGAVKFSYNEASVTEKLNAAGGGITINAGANFTRSADVSLTLANGSADEVYITNSPDCLDGGSWQPMSDSKPWRLDQLNSQAKVFAKFREKQTTKAIESGCFSDDIIHDDIAPSVQITKPAPQFTNKPTASISFVANDIGSATASGIDSTKCATASGAFENCSMTFAQFGMKEGNQEFRVIAYDLAGNASIIQKSSFTIDLTPPTVTLNSTPAKLSGEMRSRFDFSAVDALSGIDRIECRIGSSAVFSSCASPYTADSTEGVQKFSLRAFDLAGNISNEISYDWKIDRTAPVINITKMPAPESNQASALFEFDGTDDGMPILKFECALDGAGFGSCASPKTYNNLGSGIHTFAVVGYDTAGNKSLPKTYSWLIDLTAPTVEITSKPDLATSDINAAFAFIAKDSESGVASLECQIDAGAYTTCTNPKNYLALAEGPHTFAVRALDRAGNMSPPANYSWKIDITRPTIQITSTPSNPSKDSQATFGFLAKDPNGGLLARTECRIDAEPNYTNCSSPKLYTGLQDGPHTFFVRAVDQVGLMSDAASYSWVIDTMAPAINISKAPLPTLGTNESATIAFAATDTYSGIESVLCGISPALAPCLAVDEKTYSGLAPGVYSFVIVAKDKLGNEATKTVSFTIQQLFAPYSQDINVTSTNKADVLVVVDNSGSMKEEQANMASRFGTFLDQLSLLDWQVGIVTTDVSSDAAKKDGRLLEYSSLPGQYIISSAMNLTTSKSAFAATIQRPVSEGSGNEQGIGATYRAVQRYLDVGVTASQPNNSFFRTGAAFSVVVVTDADETNPAGTEIKNQPDKLLSLVQTTFPSKPFSFNSIIIKPGDTACLNTPNNEGYGNTYDAMSKLTGGIIGTVCSQDYAAQLTAMGKAVTELVRSATLKCAPVDTNGDGKADISVVTADGSTAPTYAINGSTVTFAQPLPLGLNKISYSCLKI